MHVFGMIAGTLGIVILARLAFGAFFFRRGWRYGGGCHGGPGGHWGHHRHWHGGGHWRGRHGGWRRYALYSLFERLDATPGQEKVIGGALDELRAKLRDIRVKAQESRHQAATTFRAETMSPDEASSVFAPFSAQFDQLRDAASEAMRKIHEALDDRQRGILADLVEQGWGHC